MHPSGPVIEFDLNVGPWRLPMSNTIDLGRHFEKFVAEQVAAGKFADTGDVVRAALGLLESREKDWKEKSEHLKRLIDEGIASGDAGPLDLNDIMAKAVAKSARR